MFCTCSSFPRCTSSRQNTSTSTRTARGMSPSLYPARLVGFTRRSVVLLAAALASSSALAQQATGPIRLIVPFTPGTGIDLIARQIGPKLSDRLGRPVVVENKPGASGNIGTEAVVHAPADGATLLVTVNTLVMNR